MNLELIMEVIRASLPDGGTRAVSDEPKVVDLRQASVTRLLDHLGDLVAAIQASNARYVRQEKEIGEMHVKIEALERAIREGFREVRSDLVLMENRLLSAERNAVRP